MVFEPFKRGVYMERKKDYILCVVSAVIGIVIFAVAGINKRITFCDEVYTYMIVNSSNAAPILL